jgi:hypothetical protein
LKRSRAKFKKFTLIKRCPAESITPTYLHTHIVHGVEDYWLKFTKIEMGGRGGGKKAKN